MKQKLLTVVALACFILSCSSELPKETRFDSNGELYHITFETKDDNISIRFGNASQTITVKGYKFKYRMEYSDIEFVAYKPIDLRWGYFTFQRQDSENVIGIISKSTFQFLKNKSDIPLIFKITES